MSTLTTIAGYTRTSEPALGSGNFGTVYPYVEDATGNPVAIKFSELNRGNPDDLHRICFQKEVHALRQARGCSTIVQMFKYVDRGSIGVIVLERLNGFDMRTLIANDVKFTPPQFETIITDVLKALEFLKGKQIVHNDLKPPNIVVSADFHAKLVDFGACHGVPGLFGGFGTIWYRSPEAFLYFTSTPPPDEWPIGPPSDMWSLGSVIFYILHGRPMFGGPTDESDQTDTDYFHLFHNALGAPPADCFDPAHPHVQRMYTVENQDDPFTLRDRASVYIPPKNSVAELFEQCTPKEHSRVTDLARRMIRWTGRITPEQALLELSSSSPDLTPTAAGS